MATQDVDCRKSPTAMARSLERETVWKVFAPFSDDRL